MTPEQIERLANIDRMFMHAEQRGVKLTQVLSSKQIRFLRSLVQPPSVDAVDPHVDILERRPRAHERE